MVRVFIATIISVLLAFLVSVVKADIVDDTLALIKDHRSQVGAVALTLDEKLSQTAYGQSAYLSKTNECGHTGEGGSSPDDRVRSTGFFDSCSGWGVGEIVYCGSLSAESAFNAWKNSPGHNQIMSDQSYNFVGGGVTTEPNESGTYYFTFVFAQCGSSY